MSPNKRKKKEFDKIRCEYCNSKFKKIREKQLYCSVNCRMRAFRYRNNPIVILLKDIDDILSK